MQDVLRLGAEVVPDWTPLSLGSFEQVCGVRGSGNSLCGLCSWVKNKESAQPSEREGADWQDAPVAENRSPGAGLLVIGEGPSGRRQTNIHTFKGLT